MMKREANRFLVPVLLSIATIVVAFNAWLAFRAVNSLLESEYWLEHTWQVILQVERIMSSAKDAETGNRGYLITGDDAYLEPYNAATRELPAEINQFAFLTSDNPRQQVRVPEMRAMMQLRLALLKDGIDLRRSGSQDTIRLLVLSGTGKAEMDQLRRLADDIEAEERRLLVLRTAGAQSAGVRARITVALASALDFLLIILIFRYFSQERRLRVTAEIAGERLAIARAEAESRAEEVRMLNATLEQRIKLRTAELEATNRELEAFSYSVSHDLRAPLRTVDGFSVALEEDYASAVDQVGRDYILRIRNGVHRMGAVIDALLQLSRVTRSELIREPFDLSLLVESIAAVLREENPAREITFNIEPGLRAEGDPRLLRIALENLLGNAVKFSARAPRTVVDFGWDGGKNAWFVQDYGAGFDMSYASKLFSAFNRLHGDKDFQGSGIGLATVARVIRRHYGEIWAESKIDHGATFWFTLG
jgi:signal transduction histidine kinase